MKDHEIAEFVNELTVTAKEYCGAQALRGQLRIVVLKHVDKEDPSFKCWKCGTSDIDKQQRFCPHCGACA